MTATLTHRQRAAVRIEAARRIGAGQHVDRAALAAEMFPAPELAGDEISVEEAATRLGVLPSTVHGYLRSTRKRPARLERAGGGVSASSVDAYLARRKPRPAGR